MPAALPWGWTAGQQVGGSSSSNVWSGSPNAGNSRSSRRLCVERELHNNGNANNNNRSNNNHVRLVRGGE